MRALLLAILSAFGLLAQTGLAPPAFEVASVKPSGPQSLHVGVFTYPGGRITVTNYTLEMLIEEAYGVKRFQVSGGPRWTITDRYDIEAKPPASSKSSKSTPPYPKAPPNEEQRQMLQTLLADRFQLTFHREAKEGQVYLLVAGNKPPKLQPPKDPNEFPWVGKYRADPPNTDGMAGKNASMPLLASRLSDQLERPVLDHTGLKGSFDFKYEYAAEGGSGDALGSILTLLQGVGFKLEQSRGPVETIVIDIAEKPSEN